MSITTVRLLSAAAEIAGSHKALAERLGIGETLLLKFLEDSLQLPDPLLLRAVDMILADRQGRPLGIGAPGLQETAETLQNCDRASSGTTAFGAGGGD